MSAIPNREAFRVARLGELVQQAAAMVERARAVFQASRGPVKAAARREFKRAETMLNRAEKALQAEQEGEVKGPAVQRHAIVETKLMGFDADGLPVMDDIVLREPRVVTHGKSVTLVTALDHLRKRSSITDKQLAAGKRYRAAYEMAGLDAFPIGLGEGIGGTPCSGNRRIEEAVGSSRELSRMRAALGGSYCVALVEHIAVHDLTVATWAEAHGMNAQYAMGQLSILLGMLEQQ